MNQEKRADTELWLAFNFLQANSSAFLANPFSLFMIRSFVFNHLYFAFFADHFMRKLLGIVYLLTNMKELHYDGGKFYR